MIDGLPIVRPSEALAALYRRTPRMYPAASSIKPDHVNDFHVAYLTSVAQVDTVRNSLVSALESGTSFKDWKKGLERDDVLLPHATTVWRTNVFNAFNDGRYRGYLEDKGDFPWLIYEAVDDDRTRPNHAANDGLAMPLDDERWEGRIPALGYNCRCLIINLTEDEARARGRVFDPSPDGEPDSPEWGSSPFSGRTRPSPVFKADPADVPAEIRAQVRAEIEVLNASPRALDVRAVAPSSVTAGRRARARSEGLNGVTDLQAGALFELPRASGSAKAQRFLNRYHSANPENVDPVDASFVGLVRAGLQNARNPRPGAAVNVRTAAVVGSPLEQFALTAEVGATVRVGGVLQGTAGPLGGAQINAEILIERTVTNGALIDLSEFARAMWAGWDVRLRVIEIRAGRGGRRIVVTREVGGSVQPATTLAASSERSGDFARSRSLNLNTYFEADHDWNI